jgi:hypothetical protein
MRMNTLDSFFVVNIFNVDHLVPPITIQSYPGELVSVVWAEAVTEAVVK